MDSKRFKSSKVTSAVPRRTVSEYSENSMKNYVERAGGEISGRQDDKAAARSAKKLGELSLSSDEKRRPTSGERGSRKGRKRGGRRPQSSGKGYAQDQQNMASYSSGLEEGDDSELVSHRAANPLRQVRSQHGKLFDPGADGLSAAKQPPPNLMQRPVSSSHANANANAPSSTPVRAFSPGILPVPRDKSLVQICASQAQPEIHVVNQSPPSVVQINDYNDDTTVDRMQHVIKDEQHESHYTDSASIMEQKNRPEPGLLSTESFKQPVPVPREIPEEALNTEVKMIYNGLCHIESKCRTVDQAQGHQPWDGDPAQKKELTSDHWRALIALHRTLLNEHHDFFLASQHPSASPALRRLASRYSMPARLWRHGIHSFLEVLRHRLPESLEYMLAFIYLAYQMMSLLYETVPAFESTWIECLGDLGRYRMAIEDADMRDREVWNNVARYWYQKAADKNPHVGRLYHHLAILARSDPLQQMYLYSRSLISIECFHSARESIRTLLDPVTNDHPSYSKALVIDRVFIKMMAILFTKRNFEAFDGHKEEFLQHVGRSMDQLHWKDRGVYIIVSLIGAMLDFGSGKSPLQQAYLGLSQEEENTTPAANAEGQGVQGRPTADSKLDIEEEKEQESKETEPSPEDSLYKTSLVKACELLSALLRVTLKRADDEKVFPSLHVLCVFLSSLLRVRDERSAPVVKTIYSHVPWNGLARFLDSVATKEKIKPSENPFRKQGKDNNTPLPEDYLIHDQLWCRNYFPDGWFARAGLDDVERKIELLSKGKSRVHRMLSVYGLLRLVC